MFLIARVLLMIGLIFYLSPARVPGPDLTAPKLEHALAEMGHAAASVDQLRELAPAWSAMTSPALRSEAVDALSDEIRRLTVQPPQSRAPRH